MQFAQLARLHRQAYDPFMISLVFSEYSGYFCMRTTPRGFTLILRECFGHYGSFLDFASHALTYRVIHTEDLPSQELAEQEKD